MQYLPVNLSFPVLLYCFMSFPFLSVSVPHTILWVPKSASGIFRGPTVHLASCEEETLRNLDTRGPQLAGEDLWQCWFGNTSQAVSCELGRDCSFGNLPSSQLLVGWPLSKLEHDPLEKGSWSLLGNHLLKKRMVVILWIQILIPTNFFFLQTYGMNKETNKFSDWPNLICNVFPKENTFF